MTQKSPHSSFATARRAATGRLLPVWVLLLTSVGGLSCGGRSGPPPRPTANEGLVYLLPRESHGVDVALVRLSDGAVQLVTDAPDEIEADPHWVSSVQRVLYTERPADPEKKESRLMMRDPVNGNVVSASVLHDYHESRPVVSADGRRVAFTFVSPPGLMPPTGVKLLIPMSSHDHTLGAPPGGGRFVGLDISPDGTRVVAQVHAPLRGDDLVLLASDAAMRPLSRNPLFEDVDPHFARGGDVVYFSRSVRETPTQQFQRRRAGKPDPLGGGDVCRVQIESQQVDCVVASEDAREYAAVPSPTRDEIVFVKEQGGASDLYLANADGGDVRALTHDPRRKERDPRWSPDGDHVVFTAGTAASPVILVVDRSGAVQLETPGESPDWAPPLFASGS